MTSLWSTGDKRSCSICKISTLVFFFNSIELKLATRFLKLQRTPKQIQYFVSNHHSILLERFNFVRNDSILLETIQFCEKRFNFLRNDSILSKTIQFREQWFNFLRNDSILLVTIQYCEKRFNFLRNDSSLWETIQFFEQLPFNFVRTIQFC